MNNEITSNSIRFIILVLTQVLMLNNIHVLGYVTPYIYILFILIFPVKNNRSLFLFLSFLLGFLVDLFSDSGGIHATAALVIAYIRPSVLKFCFGTVYENHIIKFSAIEFRPKIVYITILTIIHHLILFLLEVFTFSKIILVFQKTLASCIFTIFLIVLVTVIFSKKTT